MQLFKPTPRVCLAHCEVDAIVVWTFASLVPRRSGSALEDLLCWLAVGAKPDQQAQVVVEVARFACSATGQISFCIGVGLLEPVIMTIWLSHRQQREELEGAQGFRTYSTCTFYHHCNMYFSSRVGVGFGLFAQSYFMSSLHCVFLAQGRALLARGCRAKAAGA